jgi:hypothetical protein
MKPLPNRIKGILSRLPIEIKLIGLVFLGCFLFLSALVISPENIFLYFVVFSAITLSIIALCVSVIGYKPFLIMFTLWLIGAVIFIMVSLPRIYGEIPLSPYLNISNTGGRWLYHLIYSIRLLTTFAIGLIFMAITSPIEFIKWRKIGIWIAFLFRAVEYSSKSFQDTRTALMMQNNWPEPAAGLKRLSEAAKMIKNSSRLIVTTVRNIILWFPWAYLTFRKITQPSEERIYEIKNED